MNWLYWVGASYLLAGIGILVAASQRWLWRRDEYRAPSGAEPDLHEVPDGRRMAAVEEKRRLYLLAGWLSVLFGVLLLATYFAPTGAKVADELKSTVGVQQPRPSADQGTCVVDVACRATDSSGPVRTSLLWPVVGLVVVLLLAGVVLMVMGDSVWIKVAGAGVTAAGVVAGGGGLIHEMNIDSFLKIEMTNKLDELKLMIGGRVGTEHLSFVDGFAPGDSRLEAGMEPKVASVCEKWKQASVDGRTALVLIVGATDRVPLTGRAKDRYESNFGLARARAEAVRETLAARCAIPSQSMLALVSGPRNTAEVPLPAGGFPQDRRVDVWALWTPTQQLALSTSRGAAKAP